MQINNFTNFHEKIKESNALLDKIQGLITRSNKEKKYLFQDKFNQLKEKMISLSEFKSAISEFQLSGCLQLMAQINLVINDLEKLNYDTIIRTEQSIIPKPNFEVINESIKEEEKEAAVEADANEIIENVSDEINSGETIQIVLETSADDKEFESLIDENPEYRAFVNDLLMQSPESVGVSSIETFKRSISILKWIEAKRENITNEEILNLREKHNIQSTDSEFDLDNLITSLTNKEDLKVRFLYEILQSGKEVNIIDLNQELGYEIFTETDLEFTNIVIQEVEKQESETNTSELEQSVEINNSEEVLTINDYKRFAATMKEALESKNLFDSETLNVIKAAVVLISLDDYPLNISDLSIEVTNMAFIRNLQILLNKIDEHGIDDLLSIFTWNDMLEETNSELIDPTEIINIVLSASPDRPGIFGTRSDDQAENTREKITCPKSNIFLEACEQAETEVTILDEGFKILNINEYRGFHLPSLGYLVFICNQIGTSIKVLKLDGQSLDKAIETLSTESERNLYQNENYGVINMIGIKSNYQDRLRGIIDEFIECPDSFVGNIGVTPEELSQTEFVDHMLEILEGERTTLTLDQIEELQPSNKEQSQTFAVAEVLLLRAESSLNMDESRLTRFLNVLTNSKDYKQMSTVLTKIYISKAMEIGPVEIQKEMTDYSETYTEILDSCIRKLKKQKYSEIEKALVACIEKAYKAYLFEDNNRGNYYVAKALLLEKILDNLNVNPRIFKELDLDLINIVFNPEIIDIDIIETENPDESISLSYKNPSKVSFAKKSIPCDLDGIKQVLGTIENLIDLIEFGEITAPAVVAIFLNTLFRRINDLYEQFILNIEEVASKDIICEHLTSIYRDLYSHFYKLRPDRCYQKRINEMNFTSYTQYSDQDTSEYQFKYTRKDGQLEEAVLQSDIDLATQLKDLTAEDKSSLQNADTKKLSDIIYSSLK